MTPELPGYRIQRELGKGGMGMVYLAVQESTGLQVALKVLPPHLITPVTARRFQREGRAMQAIKHPNIVRVHDVGARDGTHFIAMEYVKGAPLSRTLRDNPKGLALQTAMNFGSEIASALACIHERGMTHRDLKPGNVMITPEGHAKLLDFGLVQVDGLTMLTQTGNIVGTPRYMSPEQCEGTAIDCRSDIYSFGVLLYEMLTGTAPFRSESVYDLLEMQKNAAPLPPSQANRQVPSDVEQVVLQCLEKDPNSRPQRLAEVLAILQPQGTTVAPPPRMPTASLQQTPSPRPSGRRLLRVGVMLFLLAIGIAVTSLMVHPEAQALRSQVKAFILGADDSLQDEIRDRYMVLRQAEETFKQGRLRENSGDTNGAFDHYRDAFLLYEKQAKYLLALITVAEQTQRIEEARTLVERYLKQPNADDPGGILKQWLTRD